ncbi:MAG: hypothetical protein IT384_35135 [Deltaproteobacteria bacterium]|nr:hypothetical protein [Deltaproteobacteria bacterium]
MTEDQAQRFAIEAALIKRGYLRVKAGRGAKLVAYDLLDMARSSKSATDLLSALARKRRWGPRDARVVLDASERSGWTAAEFAAHHGLHLGRVQRWLRSTPRKAEATEQIRFAEIARPQPEPTPKGVRSRSCSAAARRCGHSRICTSWCWTASSSIRTSTGPQGRISPRSRRADLGDLLRRSGLAIELDDGLARWWTFAGGRINHALKYGLEIAECSLGSRAIG